MSVATSPDRVILARLLDANPERLEQFVTNHPDPSADVVLRSAVVSKPPRRVSDETRDRLAAWVANRKGRQQDGPRRRILECLDEHGPTHCDVVLDGVTAPDATRSTAVIGALYALEDGSHIETVDGSGVSRLCDTGE